MDFGAWEKEVERVANDLLCLGDILADDDPYEVREAMAEAHASGRTPEAFVREAFGEDLARQVHDDLQRQESLAYEDTDPSELAE